MTSKDSEKFTFLLLFKDFSVHGWMDRCELAAGDGAAELHQFWCNVKCQSSIHQVWGKHLVSMLITATVLYLEPYQKQRVFLFSYDAVNPAFLQESCKSLSCKPDRCDNPVWNVVQYLCQIFISSFLFQKTHTHTHIPRVLVDSKSPTLQMADFRMVQRPRCSNWPQVKIKNSSESRIGQSSSCFFLQPGLSPTFLPLALGGWRKQLLASLHPDKYVVAE